MAYIFHQDDLPRLLSVTPGRERIFFVNKELTGMDDMLAGVMYYKQGVSSPYHLHENCEHFYFIFEGEASFESEDGIRDLRPGDLVFIPAEEKHRLRAKTPCSISSSRLPIASRPRSLTEPRTVSCGNARTATSGCRASVLILHTYRHGAGANESRWATRGMSPKSSAANSAEPKRSPACFGGCMKATVSMSCRWTIPTNSSISWKAAG